MKKLLVLVAVIVISLVFLKIFVLTPQGWKADLINPNPTPIPTPAPSQTPKQFKFDASTDLEKELESINPQVLDSDFE